MRYSKYPILLLTVIANLSFTTSIPLVITTSGIIVGTEVEYDGKTVKRFLGIPFAKPPVGDLRFKKTVPLDGWSGVLKADKMRTACSQYYPFDYDLMDKMKGKSEDCLYLNIWVPGDASPQNPKAVMFWLYAGGFTTGSNRLPAYNGTLLAAKGDVIVVTPNYRLGIFGFLYTNSEEAPGNMGLYDILEALKWVNMNIKAFGGDEKRITIGGDTAGSVASGFLTVSPLSKGLFHRVLMESGSDTPVHGDVRQANLQLGQQVATEAGCASESTTLQNNTKEVVGCLKRKSAKILVKAVYSVINASINSFLPIYGDEILPKKPSEAYENGDFHDVSVLIGNVRDEGTFKIITVFPEVFGPYGGEECDINKAFGYQIIAQILTGLNGEGRVADFYLSSVPEDDCPGIRYQVSRAIGDVNFFCIDYYFALLFSKRVDVYFYYFNHRTPTTKFANWTGVTIFSAVPYIFGGPIYESGFTREEAQLSEDMLRLWTNFVKYGVPSSKWSRFKGTDPHPYVEIIQLQGDVYDDPYQRFNNCEILRPDINL